MLRKLLILAGLTASFIFTSAFIIQDATGVDLPTGWAALVVVFVIIFIVAIFLIFQGRNTPEAVSRYHLDHGAHAHVPDHVVEAPVEATPPVVVEAAVEPVAKAEPETPSAVVEVAEAEATDMPEDQVRVGSIAVVEEIAQTVVEPDDLTRIEGIGPKINQLLNEAGIFTYAQLSNSDPAHLKSILSNAGPRFGLADPSTWPEQAGYLAAGEEDKFNALADRLRGGRHG